MPGYEGAIRYRLPAHLDQPVFSAIPIETFADPAIVPALQPAVEGRYVLIGGDIVDFDRFETPFTSWIPTTREASRDDSFRPESRSTRR